eukprot:TRINITY_DN7943_c0_g1_i1.p1 TRINITY_DN7943_c0_g1~~TRINITY_DN7943_c0_g1_i1.p1  ORF type:complete len:183 (-),score=56.78 TRINITY_DN7943_c0_g1_i1:4-552(-)
MQLPKLLFVLLFLFVGLICAVPCPPIQTPAGTVNVEAITAPAGAKPLVNPLAIPPVSSDFANSISAGSVGACPVSIIDNGFFNYSISRIHYFLMLPDGSAQRDSWGYQYLDGVKKMLRYDETFVLDAEFDANNQGAESFETLTIINGTLTNIAIGPSTDHDAVVCISVPNFPLGFMSSRTLR